MNFEERKRQAKGPDVAEAFDIMAKELFDYANGCGWPTEKLLIEHLYEVVEEHYKQPDEAQAGGHIRGGCGMSKYKVGDRVRVREDLAAGSFYGEMSASRAMAKLKGEVVLIEKLLTENRYEINLDKGCHFWSNEMFEGFALEEKPTAEETVERIRGKMLDYSNAQGAIGEIELLKYINEKLSEYYNGYGVEPQTLNYWSDDSVPDPKLNKIVINLSEENKKEIIKELADELEKRIGKEWML